MTSIETIFHSTNKHLCTVRGLTKILSFLFDNRISILMPTMPFFQWGCFLSLSMMLASKLRNIFRHTKTAWLCLLFFSITVCILYYSAPVSDVQHSGQKIIHLTQWSPHCPRLPPGLTHSDHDTIDYILHVVIYISVTILLLPICTLSLNTYQHDVINQLSLLHLKCQADGCGQFWP